MNVPFENVEKIRGIWVSNDGESKRWIELVVNYKGSQGQTERAEELQEEEVPF
jgi:hypothetical protein